MQTFVYALHFIACFVLIFVVLLQRGKGAELGASLGGGGANTIFGSRGAGNFLTKITTASAVTFMITSLTLSYMGYKSSDVQLFDPNETYEVPVQPEKTPAAAESGAAANATNAPSDGTEGGGGLVEIPQKDQ